MARAAVVHFRHPPSQNTSENDFDTLDELKEPSNLKGTSHSFSRYPVFQNIPFVAIFRRHVGLGWKKSNDALGLFHLNEVLNYPRRASTSGETRQSAVGPLWSTTCWILSSGHPSQETCSHVGSKPVFWEEPRVRGGDIMGGIMSLYEIPFSSGAPYSYYTGFKLRSTDDSANLVLEGYLQVWRGRYSRHHGSRCTLLKSPNKSTQSTKRVHTSLYHCEAWT